MGKKTPTIIFTSKFSVILTFFCSSKNSLEINTEEEYKQFKAGKLRTNKLFIHINANAHPDVLGEVGFYTNTERYHSLTFEDSHGSSIRVTPMNSAITAHFVSGTSQLTRLPKNMTSYDVKVENGTVVTTDDIEAILQWEWAEEVQIIDETNVAKELYERLNEMQCRRLQRLTLSIPSEYRQIKVDDFFEKFAHLDEVSFQVPASMPTSELRQFALTAGDAEFLFSLVLSNKVVFVEIL